MAEARLVCLNAGAEAAVFDGELTGSQLRNLSAALQVEVIDRTMLILEIFRSRATTNEENCRPSWRFCATRCPGCRAWARCSAASARLRRGGGPAPAAAPARPSWSWTAGTSAAASKRWKAA